MTILYPISSNAPPLFSRPLIFHLAPVWLLAAGPPVGTGVLPYGDDAFGECPRLLIPQNAGLSSPILPIPLTTPIFLVAQI